MALSATEQLEILRVANNPANDPENPGIGPGGLNGDLKFYNYVSHQAVMFASNWVENYKLFDEIDAEGNPINELSSNYRDKMINSCSKAFRLSGSNLVDITTLFVAVLGESEYSYEQVTQANDAGWNSVAGEMMRETFEKFAGVRIEEKNAYDNL